MIIKKQLLQTSVYESWSQSDDHPSSIHTTFRNRNDLSLWGRTSRKRKWYTTTIQTPASRNQERYCAAIHEFCRGARNRSVLAYVTGAATTARLAGATNQKLLESRQRSAAIFFRHHSTSRKVTSPFSLSIFFTFQNAHLKMLQFLLLQLEIIFFRCILLTLFILTAANWKLFAFYGKFVRNRPSKKRFCLLHLQVNCVQWDCVFLHDLAGCSYLH